MKTSYSTTAGTAFVRVDYSLAILDIYSSSHALQITFDNVRVPVGNTLGEEGGGIYVILRCV